MMRQALEKLPRLLGELEQAELPACTLGQGGHFGSPRSAWWFGHCPSYPEEPGDRLPFGPVGKDGQMSEKYGTTSDGDGRETPPPAKL